MILYSTTTYQYIRNERNQRIRFTYQSYLDLVKDKEHIILKTKILVQTRMNVIDLYL
jgi:hypothetical protein